MPKAVGFGVRAVFHRNPFVFPQLLVSTAREKRFAIGQFPRWSVAAARERAIELRKKIDKGHDPAGQKRERRDAANITDLIERYKRDHLPTKSQTKMRLNDEQRQLDMIGKALGMSTKVSDVHGGDIAEMHRRITETRGPVRGENGSRRWQGRRWTFDTGPVITTKSNGPSFTRSHHGLAQRGTLVGDGGPREEQNHN